MIRDPFVPHDVRPEDAVCIAVTPAPMVSTFGIAVMSGVGMIYAVIATAMIANAISRRRRICSRRVRFGRRETV